MGTGHPQSESELSSNGLPQKMLLKEKPDLGYLTK
jgi:hypothetical protein